MEKQISIIRRKMIFAVCALAALGIWQHEFIVKGVMANVQINLTILSTGAFGVISAFLFVAKLRNEVVAFRALKEMSDDIRRLRDDSADDASWRYARCAEPALIFRRPRLLGHAYDLVTEELARTKNIRISVETMNTLVHKIEASINDEKSLIVYISGLLVFMGLIGTFIGLLHMVSAIGGIIGSLSKSGDAGSGAFSELLGALEEPLRGMASGFASSLFGLFCSLLVGLMGRFAGQAAGVLKAHFESWLAGVVQLSDAEIAEHSRPHDDVAGPSGGPVADAAMIKLVGSLLVDYGKVAAVFNDAASALSNIQRAQSDQSNALERIAATLDQAMAAQGLALDGLASQKTLKDAVEDLTRAQRSWAQETLAQREEDAARLGGVLQTFARAHSEDLRAMWHRQIEAAAQIATGVSSLSASVERLALSCAPDALEGAVERGFAAARRAHGEDLRIAAQQIADRVDRGLAAQQVAEEARTRTLIMALREREADAPALRAVETALGGGLTRISQAVEGALAAYASLARVALTALERTRPAEPAREPGSNSEQGLSGAA